MTVLILDNYDSFTFNLAHLIGALGADFAVIRNDAIDLPGVLSMGPSHVVISPGPGHPGELRDFGVCGPVIHALGPRTPILGVCLGHQGIVHHLGGRVVRAPSVVHGKTSALRHTGRGLFNGLPERIEAMRYHSLVAEPGSLPEALRVTARTDDGLIMAVEHALWPMAGVQFHPESVGTPCGRALMANFLANRG